MTFTQIDRLNSVQYYKKLNEINQLSCLYGYWLFVELYLQLVLIRNKSFLLIEETSFQ